MHKYIVFEGADGIGKTTLAKNFAKLIEAKFTYEPFGHTKETKMLREWALTKEVPRLAREYLLLAGRSLGYTEVFKWLMDGECVVSDRSFLSGMVYAHMENFSFDQWFGMAEPLGIGRGWNKPFVILCSNEKYQNKDNPEDRYDGMGEKFHNIVDQAFKRGLNYLNHSLLSRGLDLGHIEFQIDFDKSEQQNLDRLVASLPFPLAISQGNKEWPQEYLMTPPAGESCSERDLLFRKLADSLHDKRGIERKIKDPTYADMVGKLHDELAYVDSEINEIGKRLWMDC